MPRYSIEIETDYPPTVIAQAFVEGWQDLGLIGEPNPDVKPAPGCTVLAAGSPFDGVTLVGPFVDGGEAAEYADRHFADTWWTIDLESPKPDETKVIEMAPQREDEWS